jgi:hypothetical protein
MPTNFYVQYLAALDAIILAEGGTVPTVAPLNFQQADIARLDALVAAVEGDLPPVTLNYRSAAIARWQAAITGLDGTLPTTWINFEQALVLHIAAFQEARTIDTAAIVGADTDTNVYEKIIALLEATP